MMQYKGYVAQIEIDAEAKLLHGEVANIRDVVTFQGRDVEELEIAFRESVDDYLAFCRERGEEADKPFSGKFVTRISPVLHRRASSAAAAAGKSLNAWIADQIEHATSEATSLDRVSRGVRVAAATRRVGGSKSTRAAKRSKPSTTPRKK